MSQTDAFASSVLPNIYAFHRYTRYSSVPSHTQELQYQLHNTVKPYDLTIDLKSHLHALYAQ